MLWIQNLTCVTANTYLFGDRQKYTAFFQIFNTHVSPAQGTEETQSLVLKSIMHINQSTVTLTLLIGQAR